MNKKITLGYHNLGTTERQRLAYNTATVSLKTIFRFLTVVLVRIIHLKYVLDENEEHNFKNWQVSWLDPTLKTIHK